MIEYCNLLASANTADTARYSEVEKLAEKYRDVFRTHPHATPATPDQITAAVAEARAQWDAELQPKIDEAMENLLAINEAIPKRDAAIRNATLTKLLRDVCKQCPIHEEIPVEDYCAESCDGCLTRKICIESLRTNPNATPATLYTPEMVENRIKAIRNAMLDEIIPTLGMAIQTDVSDNDYVMIEDLESTIESLRTPDKPQQQECKE